MKAEEEAELHSPPHHLLGAVRTAEQRQAGAEAQFAWQLLLSSCHCKAFN